MREMKIQTKERISLHVTVWEPKSNPKGIVQIIHGIAEYTARYNQFAEFLSQHDYLVVGEDHPGHGYTAEEGELGYMTGGWTGTVSGIHQVYEMIHQKYPSVPYYMLGHSMGSFLLRTYLFTYHTPLSGAIISGTGWLPSLILPLGAALCKEEALRLGDRKASTLLEKIIFGGYNKEFTPNRTPYDWLSRDHAIVDAYAADPLCGFSASIQLCQEMMMGLRMIQNVSNLSRMQKDLPIYFFAGELDPVGDMGKGVMKCIQAFERVGMKDVSWKLYPNMRHETLNEIDKEIVYQDILIWLEK